MVIQFPLPAQFDVVVVGGGPAGLASAIAMRQAGLSVLLADRAAPDIDKACGEGLMPDAVAALGRLGIRVGPEHGAVFRGIRFLEQGRLAEAVFAQDIGFGIRRTTLHRLLVDRAIDVGVVMRWRSEVFVPAVGAVRVDGQAVRCQWVVAADGIHSRLRRLYGLGPSEPERRRASVRLHYRVRPWTDLVEVHWGPGVQAYVTPIGPDQVCVALIGEEECPTFENLAQFFPNLAWRLEGAKIDGAVRGAVSVSRQLPRIVSGRLVLVGDASGSVDAITGEGMALAFRQAEILAAALVDGDPARYAALHREVGQIPLAMSRVLLVMARHDRLRNWALRLLVAQPWIFGLLLAMHVRSPANPPEIRPVMSVAGVPASRGRVRKWLGD